MTEQEKDEAIKLGERNGRLDKKAGRRLDVSYNAAYSLDSYPYWYGMGYRKGWDTPLES